MSIKRFVNDLQIGSPWSYRSLTVHPLVGPANSTVSYLALDEATRSASSMLSKPPHPIERIGDDL